MRVLLSMGQCAQFLMPQILLCVVSHGLGKEGMYSRNQTSPLRRIIFSGFLGTETSCTDPVLREQWAAPWLLHPFPERGLDWTKLV